MSRYIQHDLNKKKPEKKERPKPLSKAGKYTETDLDNAKKIISPNGGHR